MRIRFKVSFDSLLEAFEFASFGEPLEHLAYLCTETGEFVYHSEYGDNEESLPDDIEDSDKYIAIPDNKSLGLGKPLALKFAGEFMPAHQGKIQDMFRRPGAYVRFKELLAQCEMLEQWHAYEDKAGREALRGWCAENGIEIDG